MNTPTESKNGAQSAIYDVTNAIMHLQKVLAIHDMHGPVSINLPTFEDGKRLMFSLHMAFDRLNVLHMPIDDASVHGKLVRCDDVTMREIVLFGVKVRWPAHPTYKDEQ